MRALIVAFYVVLCLFLISTLIYIAHSEKTLPSGMEKERVEYQSEHQVFRR